MIKNKAYLFMVALACILFTSNALALTIKYSYGGQFGVYGIADTASAYQDRSLLAEAEAIRIIKKSPGPNAIEIKETHYNSSGSVIYEGLLQIQFGFGGGYVINEESMRGKKRFSVFGSWPAGN